MKLALKNIPFFQIVLPIFSIHILGMLLYLGVQSNLPPVVPLLYGLPYGEEQLVPKLFLLSPLVVGLVILILNTVIIKFTKDNFSQKALLYLIIATSLLSIVTVTKIVFLVGSF